MRSDDTRSARRRGRSPLLVGGVLAALVLGACSDGHEDQDAIAPGATDTGITVRAAPSPSPPTMYASSSTSMPSQSGTVSVGGAHAMSTAKPGDTALIVSDLAAHLPTSWENVAVVEPGWDAIPEHVGGMFVGFEGPTENRSTLRFIAVSDSGTVMWQKERPAACTGYAVSRADSAPVVILTDADATGERFRTTASGYDLISGEKLWGPTPVPGSLQGPGLVFAASALGSTMGASGPRVALDPETGRTVADESDDPAAKVIGEYDGTVVMANDESLWAVDASDGTKQWTVPNVPGADAAAPPGVEAPAGTALVSTSADTGAALVDLDTGRVLARHVRNAAFDPLSETYVALDDKSVYGIGDEGKTWHLDVAPGSHIAAAGLGFVYVVGDGKGRVLNALSGHGALAYDPDVRSRFAVPQVISPTDAAVFRIDGSVLLATSPRSR